MTVALALGALADAHGLGAAVGVQCLRPPIALATTTRLVETRPRAAERTEP